MIYLWCPRPSFGARDLTHKINELAGRRVAVRKRTDRYAPLATDLTVGWGESVPWGYNQILNARHIGNKHQELLLMSTAGIPCPASSPVRTADWWPRTRYHRCGMDLLRHDGGETVRADYWVEWVPTVAELRCHVFRGQVRRVGIKTPDPTETGHHPTIRSEAAGWTLVYGRSKTGRYATGAVRDACVKAIAAVGYDFGAVDVGIKADGSPVVFEVNSAPGLDGRTLLRYAEWILGYAREKGAA